MFERLPVSMRITLRDLREKTLYWIAWKLPRGVIYWAAIRLVAHATKGQWSGVEVPALNAMDALERWGGDNS